ncbi:hypothetical protein DES39_0888 [Orbus hercynius]|uniref:FAD-dependent oxidoreductase 2 FAD-binding domain-containing protein n=1 Tax=Orbus hercynius TaxID=593135 RepID=A0A495RJF4_9GAMM|nr:NAD(P)/FAD-dependent oxidoreductase [Orbus hercynius]RKS87647.1 hypothetical protein DES39_0888 [Orbus hercynius]
MKHYDVVIIGAGVSGIFAALKLTRENKRILMIDAGKPLNERLSLLGNSIASSRTADRYFGFGGLGISEGKYNYTNDFGGMLANKIGAKHSFEYQQQVDQLLCQYGAKQRPLYHTFDAELAERARSVGFTILSTQTRHLGTALSVEIFQAFAADLQSKVEFCFNTVVERITPQSSNFVLTLAHQHPICADNVVISVGRHGMDWLEPIAQQLGLSYEQTRLDLGFRIEMHGQQLAPLLQKTLETKLHYQTADYSATTYCMNPKGRVIAKYQEGLVMPDGQNSHEVGQSQNLNFSLFMPKWFASRDEADHYLTTTIGNINQQRDRIAAQRLGDIDDWFSQRVHEVTPTLSEATFAELSSMTPDNYLSYTCDFLRALERLLGEQISGNTILYAMDSKSYAPVIKTDSQFVTDIANLFIIGDCSGISSSLSQAAASGLWVADHIAR